MKLQENPLLPQGNNTDALLRQLQVLMRQVSAQVNALSSGKISATLNAATSVPTTGTWSTGDFVLNSNPVVQGPDNAKYVVDGWKCVQGGTPGVWVEVRLPVALPPSAPPLPAPSPGTPGLYSSRVQGELMAGATALGAAAIAAAFLPPDFDGTGVADQDTTAGVTKTATFSGVSAGTYTINFRFFGFADQRNYVQIDSGTSTPYVWHGVAGAYQILSISGVSLTGGTHTVKFISDYGYTYIDYVELVQETAVAPPPPAPAPTPAPPPGVGPFFPFGSRADGAYPNGISVTGYTNAQKDALVKACYDAWKSNRLKLSPAFIPTSGIYAGQTITDAYYVDSPQTIVSASGSSPAVYSVTVSEAIGYGMLIVVLMAHTDPTKGEVNAQAIFDGLFKFWRGNPAYGITTVNNAHIYSMDWRVGTRNAKDAPPLDLSSQGGGWSASDGEMDAILACMMAHRQWGSSGAINYWQEAINSINAQKVANFASNGLMYIPSLGQYHDVSRTSDYMPGHFRAFKLATNDTFWDDARVNSLAILNTMVSGFAPTTKLTPGFIYQPLSATPVPSPGGKIESDVEGYYDQNAVRNPWRWATDYLFSGDAGWKTLTNDIISFLKTSSGGNPGLMSWTYKLDGTPLSNLYFEPTTSGCATAGAMVDVAHQAFLNALFTKNTGSFDTRYFSAELQLLPLIVASGNWWLPT